MHMRTINKHYFLLMIRQPPLSQQAPNPPPLSSLPATDFKGSFKNGLKQRSYIDFKGSTEHTEDISWGGTEMEILFLLFHA